jgi:hypothetical protein
MPKTAKVLKRQLMEENKLSENTVKTE